MIRKGSPFDNVPAVSLIKTLESEEVHMWEYRKIEDLNSRIPYLIGRTTIGFISRGAVGLLVNISC
ncbi:MAG: hypothetical protein PVJ84_12570 [Desulfobacteraceae bacterium]|jgi:hypothetical protein